MQNKINSTKHINAALYDQLSKLSPTQFKTFYAALVHYWVNHKFFISKQNFFNLWCELNLLCHEFDDSFPNQYEDYDAVKSFCHYHPYYFIDRIPLDLIAGLFANHLDDHIDILTDFANLLSSEDMRQAYSYINDALGLSESIDDLVSETQTHVKFFSY